MNSDNASGPAGEVYAESAYCSDGLWLPAPARAKHDEPITAEAWERRERARREAEAMIAKAFPPKP